MTPRSRKPVMLLAGLNAGEHQQTAYTNHSSFSSLREEDEEEATDAANNVFVTSQSEEEACLQTPVASREYTAPTSLSSNTGVPICPYESSVTSESGALNLNDASTSLTSTFR